MKTPPFLHSISGKGHMNTETTRVHMDDTNCVGCGQCISFCTTGAMQPANRTSEIEIAKAQKLLLVAVVSPAARVAVAEGMGMGVGTAATAQLIAGLRKLGFEYVFDVQWAADLCALEDAKEMRKARQEDKCPIFTSCCSGWINLVETRYPETIMHVSTAKSPDAILCRLVKNHFARDLDKRPDELFVVDISPCTAKKFEIDR